MILSLPLELGSYITTLSTDRSPVEPPLAPTDILVIGGEGGDIIGGESGGGEEIKQEFTP